MNSVILGTLNSIETKLDIIVSSLASLNAAEWIGLTGLVLTLVVAIVAAKRGSARFRRSQRNPKIEEIISIIEYLAMYESGIREVYHCFEEYHGASGKGVVVLNQKLQQYEKKRQEFLDGLQIKNIEPFVTKLNRLNVLARTCLRGDIQEKVLEVWHFYRDWLDISFRMAGVIRQSLLQNRLLSRDVLHVLIDKIEADLINEIGIPKGNVGFRKDLATLSDQVFQKKESLASK